MTILLKTEEACLLVLSVFLFYPLEFSWWWYPLLFLIPDIGIAGYLINSVVGAFTYNILHHRGFAVVLYLVGVFTGIQILQLSGLILFGHAAFDRVLGYGLKYQDSFFNTHLGHIGKQ